MRIVYDDNRMCYVLRTLTDFCERLTTKEDIREYTSPDYVGRRVEQHLLREEFMRRLGEDFELGKRYMPQGLANCQEFPLYYRGNPEELQQVATLRTGTQGFGDASISIDNYAGDVIISYRITQFRVSKWNADKREEECDRGRWPLLVFNWGTSF